MKRNTLFGWMIGLGLVLTAFHNASFPLMEAGMIFACGGIVMALVFNRKQIDRGSNWLFIPIVLIAVSVALSGLNGGWQRFIGTTILAALMVGCYLVGRILKDDLFKPFMFAVIAEAISCVVYGIINPGIRNGGIFSLTNYDISTGILMFGLVVSTLKRQWWVLSIVIAGLFFTGAEEGVFALSVLVIIIIVRRDWSKKLILPFATLILLLAICTPIGITDKLYTPMMEKFGLVKVAVQDTPIAVVADKVIPEVIQKPIVNLLNKKTDTYLESIGVSIDEKQDILNLATGYRWIEHWKVSPLKPFGYGYNMTEFYWGIPHNMVLIIIEQVGLLAALSWVFVMGYCLVKTRWYYLIIMIITLGVFDHFMWTQVGMWWWCAVGVATGTAIESDKIFHTKKKSLVNYELQEAKDRHARMIKLMNGGNIGG